jgi:hypothetical protein
MVCSSSRVPFLEQLAFYSLLVTCTNIYYNEDLYILPTLHLFVLFLFQNEQQILPPTTQAEWFL